ncbi:MAG TPA: 6-phosphogluconolactonase [Candidatus Dormibacteraeota bacterium]|nr:6-phosphogluconolactonase [Candidatus Dormibacteraeota bacterium]
MIQTIARETPLPEEKDYMKNVELTQFDSADALVKAVVQEWFKLLAVRPETAGPYLVALSGGRIAQTFCSEIASSAQKEPGILSAVHFFWADERCVPPEHADSNYKIAHDWLFKPMQIPEKQVHRIRGEAEPAVAAKEAEADLRQTALMVHGDQPVIDLVFLGVGENGHIASLFPEESEEARQNRAVYRGVTVTKPPANRVTLGYPALEAARNVWLLASGTGKEQALKDSLAKDGLTPLARVLKSRPLTRIFSDIKI